MSNPPAIPVSRERERYLTPCGTTITESASQGMADEDGHPISIVHAHALDLAVTAVDVIKDLHRPHVEGFFPWCIEDGKIWPCPTRKAIS